MKRLEKAGKMVTYVMPEKAKQDLNDVLKESGKEAVLAVLNRPLTKEYLNKLQDDNSGKMGEHSVNSVVHTEDYKGNILSLNQAEKSLFQNSQSLNKAPLKSHKVIVPAIKKELEREI